MNKSIKPLLVAVLVGALSALLGPAAAQGTAPLRGDFIVAVINQELVTAFEVTQRLQRAREAAARSGEPAPPEARLRQQVVDSLVEERVILSHARDMGVRVDDSDLERAIANIAAQNQVTLAQLRDRMAADGIDYARFRANVRDQLLIERVREREVLQRVRISDTEVDNFLDTQRAAAAATVELNIAQMLLPVPEGADDAAVAAVRARAEAALARVIGGEPFATVVREVSADGNKERGGEIGLRPADRLPDVFVEAVRGLPSGAVAPTLLRTGAGFHVLKVVERKEGSAFNVTQTRARHILIRAAAGAAPDAAMRRLAELRRQIDGGQRQFEDVAREVSEDGSAVQGGDLGWVSPGAFVPEFEQVMDRLPINGLSQPVRTRFGMHLIQVLERRTVAVDAKQLRQQAREVLRERKFEEAYLEWVRELRSRAYIEMRESPT